jgi:hypothetical protein
LATGQAEPDQPFPLLITVRLRCWSAPHHHPAFLRHLYTWDSNAPEITVSSMSGTEEHLVAKL